MRLGSRPFCTTGAQEVFREYFGAQLAGARKSMHAVLDQNWLHEVSKITIGTTWFDSDSTATPGLSNLKSRMGSCNIKALAEDRFGAELTKALPDKLG